MTALGVKVAAARAAGALSRRSGRGGTSLPGKLLMRLEPHAIGRLSARLANGSAVISATNGKTTTAAMVAGILERRGARLVHNRAGANMAGGVATALLDGSRDADTGLFEVDEFWLGQVVAELRPRALLLANLFRDQLDRYGELDTIADRWLDVCARTSADLVLNADDPTVADLG
ncbi:MAG TPA: Mur ligase family protein, partial [Solirubrobacteraceae bacterium]